MYQNKEQKVHQFSKIKEQNTLYQNKEQNALYQNKEQLLVVQDKEQNQDKEEPFGKHLLFKWGWTVQCFSLFYLCQLPTSNFFIIGSRYLMIT